MEGPPEVRTELFVHKEKRTNDQTKQIKAKELQKICVPLVGLTQHYTVLN